MLLLVGVIIVSICIVLTLHKKQPSNYTIREDQVYRLNGKIHRDNHKDVAHALQYISNNMVVVSTNDLYNTLHSIVGDIEQNSHERSDIDDVHIDTDLYISDATKILIDTLKERPINTCINLDLYLYTIEHERRKH